MRKPVILGLREGRRYALGKMEAVFKADGEESADAYSVSEWWMEPGCTGVGAHSHEANDEMFFVIEGKAEILVADQWREVSAGGMVIIPAGVTHDFRNLSDERAGLLNVFIPGGFEKNMPAIVDWFAEHGDSGKAEN